VSDVELGINLAIATKRWPEPEAWAAFVRDDLGLELVQFSYDLLDPWWPDEVRARQAERVRAAAEAAGIRIHSAQIGFAGYSSNMLLGPDPELRALGERWWERAIDVAAGIGALAMGGPLGALSVTSAAAPGEREARYEELLDILERLSRRAADSGLEALLVEPTPLHREIPGTIEETRRLAADLRDRTAVPVRYVLDVGHAMYQPLYGSDAPLGPWLEAVRDDIAVLHLQNTDFQSDSHWGWPDERGLFDVESFRREIDAMRIDAPVILEIVHPFELDDDEMRAHVRSSVEHCSRALQGAGSR
jgi:sugar phosphate isomerase/epimerase